MKHRSSYNSPIVGNFSSSSGTMTLSLLRSHRSIFRGIARYSNPFYRLSSSLYSASNRIQFQCPHELPTQIEPKIRSFTTQTNSIDHSELFASLPDENELKRISLTKIPCFKSHRDQFSVHCSAQLVKQWRDDIDVLQTSTWSDSLRGMYTFDLIKQVLKGLELTEMKIELDDQIRLKLPMCMNEILVKHEEGGCILICLQAAQGDLWEHGTEGTKQLLFELSSVGELLQRMPDASVQQVWGLISDFERFQPFVYCTRTGAFYKCEEQPKLNLKEILDEGHYPSLLPVVGMLEFMLRSYSKRIDWEKYVVE